MKVLLKESYDIDDSLKQKLNSILADEFLASEAYYIAKYAMKGNKQHLLEELAEKNGKDELEDHFKNLCEWMQSKGIKVVTSRSDMEKITNCTPLDFSDGMSTTEIIDKLILSEEEAIAVYEDVIPETKLDLNTMLCGFLKDEREHLKALMDVKNEMGGGDKSHGPKHKIYEGNKMRMDEEETFTYTASGIQWDYDDDDLDWSVSDRPELPDEIDVEVPVSVIDQGEEAIEDYISDYITDVTGYCHNGFSY